MSLSICSGKDLPLSIPFRQSVEPGKLMGLSICSGKGFPRRWECVYTCTLGEINVMYGLQVKEEMVKRSGQNILRL